MTHLIFFYMNNTYFNYFPSLPTCTMGLVQGDITIQSLNTMETREGYSLIRVRVKVVSPFFSSMYLPRVSYYTLGIFKVIHKSCESGHPQCLKL